MFRFTIRDVLWLMTLIAVVITWQLDRAWIWREAARDREIVNRFKKMDIDLEWALEAAERAVRVNARGYHRIWPPPKPSPSDIEPDSAEPIARTAEM
jgi:hypothetical protein